MIYLPYIQKNICSFWTSTVYHQNNPMIQTITERSSSIMAGTDDYIREACDTLIQLSADEKKQMEYEAREKAIRNYQSQMQSAENAGFRKGKQAGFQEGEQSGFQKGEQSGLKKAKLVFQLNGQGKTISEVAAACQMTEQEVTDTLS